MDDDEIRRALLDAGWSVDRVALYDEEGVEGWEWCPPPDRRDLDYHAEVGDWCDAPPLNDKLRAFA